MVNNTHQKHALIERVRDLYQESLGESRRVSESWRALQEVSESLRDFESSRKSPNVYSPHSEEEREEEEEEPEEEEEEEEEEESEGREH